MLHLDLTCVFLVGPSEALNQGEPVDLDALMADLCTIENELSTIGKPGGGSMRGSSARQKAAGRVTVAPAAGSGGSSGGSTSSSTRASPAGSVRQGRPLASNLSLDDITAQLEKASLSMDEAARQTSSGSSCSSSTSSCSSAGTTTTAAATTMRRPSATSLPPQQQQQQLRRTGSVGGGSEVDGRSVGHSSRSSASASSMDSLDMEKGPRGPEKDEGPGAPNSQVAHGQSNTEVRIHRPIFCRWVQGRR